MSQSPRQKEPRTIIYDVNFLTSWFPVVVPEIKDFLPDQEPHPFVFEGGGGGVRCQQFV